jgi:hypothetical protein
VSKPKALPFAVPSQCRKATLFLSKKVWEKLIQPGESGSQMRIGSIGAARQTPFQGKFTNGNGSSAKSGSNFYDGPFRYGLGVYGPM